MKKNNIQPTKKYIGTTADGVRVIDRADSHAHYESSLTKELLAEAISKVKISDELITKATIDFGRTIGTSACVEVDPAIDDIVYVRRGNRKGLTPMVKNRCCEPCSCVTVVLIEHGSTMTLLTAYVGKAAPKEPWDESIKSEDELTESRQFWSTHAIVCGPLDGNKKEEKG